MKQKTVVYVQNKHHKPLMPTTRCGHVRKLLRSGKAVCICRHPFTIRLKYDTPDVVQDLYFGIDTGRENIGIAVSDEKGNCVYRADVVTSNKAVHKNMIDRAGFRRARRHHKRQAKQRKALRDGNQLKHGDDAILRSKTPCKSVTKSFPGMDEHQPAKVINPAESQIANREHRDEGWMTPSGRALVQAHLNAFRMASRLLPISHISIERVAFDFQKLDNADIRAWEYGKGPLYGFEKPENYISAKQHGHCLFCDKPIAQYHHAVHRAEGGTDRICNIFGLCEEHHRLVHNDPAMDENMHELAQENNRQYKVSLLNSVMPAVIEAFKATGIPVSISEGHNTADTRNAFGIDKDHCNDAWAISMYGRSIQPEYYCRKYDIRHYKKKSGNIISALGSRTYWLNGKCVAVNRHKAMNQKADSLEEYMAEYAETHSDKECRQHFHELVIRPEKRIYTFHKAETRQTYHAGDLIKYEKHNKIKGNTKRLVFPAAGINMQEGKIDINGTQNRKMKFCHFLEGGSLQYVMA